MRSHLSDQLQAVSNYIEFFEDVAEVAYGRKAREMYEDDRYLPADELQDMVPIEYARLGRLERE